MNEDHPASNKGAKKSRSGEQFADPLSWNPDHRPPGPPVARNSRGGDPTDQRERDINRRILQEYGKGPLDAFKPVIAMLIVGVIVFSQVDRTNRLNAAIYTGMAMSAAGALYVMIARDSLPPLLSMLFRACFVLGVIAIIGWFVVNHSDTFKPPGETERENRKYRQVADPTVQ